MKKLLTLALASGALVATGGASALTITDSDSFTLLTPEELSDTPYIFTLDMFDISTLPAATGNWELDNVTVTFDIRMDTSGHLTNTANATINYASLKLGADVIDNDNSLGVNFSWSTQTEELTYEQVYTGWLDGDVVSFGPGSAVWDPTDYTGAVAAFLGSGTWTNTVTASGKSTQEGSTNYDSSVVTHLSGTMTVTYDYHDEPENNVPAPATLLLLGMGLVGIGAARRRR